MWNWIHTQRCTGKYFQTSHKAGEEFHWYLNGRSQEGKPMCSDVVDEWGAGTKESQKSNKK